MKTDKKSQGVGTPSRNELLKSLNLLRPEIFQSLRLHGNTKWLPHVLVGAALAWVWSLEPTLPGRRSTRPWCMACRQPIWHEGIQGSTLDGGVARAKVAIRSKR